MRYYRLGNARLASDILLSGLPEAEAGPDPEITIRRGTPVGLSLQWIDYPVPAEATPSWATIDHLCSSDGRWYRIRYDYRGHWADFTIRHDGREVCVDAREGESDAEISNLIEGPILARAMRLAGKPCLHATALSADGKAISLMGASGAGKSSLAWAMVQKGCRLVTDDMVGFSIEGGVLMVQPGRARLRIWPDAARQLGIEASISGELFPTAGEMNKLGVRDPAAMAEEPVPLHAIYRIERRNSALTSPQIVAMPHHARLAELAANIHGMIAPGPAGRRRELALFAEVAAAVPIYSLTMPDDLAGLPAMAAELRHRLFE